MATKGGVLIDAGVLTLDGSRITPSALDSLFKRIEELLEFGGGSSMFPCFPALKPGTRVNIRDKNRFEDLHKQLIENYTNAAKVLNVKGQFMLLPIADPIALMALLDLKLPQVGSLDELVAMIPKLPTILLEAGLPATDILKLPTKNIPTPPIPNVPPIPGVAIPQPDPKFLFDVNAPKLDLLEFLSMPLKLPNVFASLVLNLLDPGAILDILSLKLTPICKALKDAKIFGTISETASVKIATTQALSEKIGEAMTIAVVGSTLGSDPKGATGLLGTKFGYTPPDTIVTKSGKSILAVPGIEKTTPQFRQKLIRICENLEINPDHLASVISVESGKTFSPSIMSGDTVLPDGRIIHRAKSGAVGLIQFTGYTAGLLKTTKEKLANMSAEEQLDYVEKYYRLALKDTSRLKTAADVYIVIAYASALYKQPSAIALTKESDASAYAGNPAWDREKSGVVLRKNITAPVENVYRTASANGKRISADDDSVS